MQTIDVVILTDNRYVNPKDRSTYMQNILTEDELVKKALEKEGLIVDRKAWDDPQFDWSTARFLLFRTTWDYFDRFEEFFAWFNKVSRVTSFLNTEAIIRWNIDKHYLKDLTSKGIHCAKTRFIEHGISLSLEELHQQTQWKNTVLKPCISGSARHTYKLDFGNIKTYETIFRELISKEAMMLQPFQHKIIEKGEVSMMVIGGKFTHAVLKIAKAGDFRVQDDFGGNVESYTPSREEIIFAEAAVKACPELPVYARVDIFEDNDGKTALAELELIEPEMWFRFYPKAASTLANFIKKQMF